MRFVIMVGVNK